jgi:CRP/FNR family cyclic AMP-dependent transcriptional regulator
MRPSSVARLHIEPLLHSLGTGRRAVAFHEKQVIFSDGNASDSIFYILKGTVKFTVTSARGKEAVVDILNGGNFFGESALAPSRPRRTVQAVAVTDVRLVKIEPEALLHLIHHDADVCDAFLAALIALNARIIRNHADNLLYASEERLARTLVGIARIYDNPEQRPLPKLSQQDLANMIGVTRQRVNTIIKRFRKLGFVNSGPSLKVDSSIRKLIGHYPV